MIFSLHNIISKEESRFRRLSELKKPVKLQDKLGDTLLDLTLYPVFDIHGNVI
jgi:hypothetical protein